MKRPVVSVIVSVYKAEKYIHSCLKSLLKQTLTDFEILLVDDGSPDNSGEICDEYARQDCRIKSYHKTNEGVSATRQFGLDRASGEYVIHVDPDDWIEPTMLEEMYVKAAEQNSDMVVCDYWIEEKGKSYYIKQRPSELTCSVMLLELLRMQLHGSCCNKLVKRKLFKKYQIRFPEDLSYCEDLYVNVSLLMNDIKIAYLPKAYYHYVYGINSNSLSKSYSIKNYFSDLQRKEIFQKLFENNVLQETCMQFIDYSIVKRAFSGNIWSSKEFKHLMYEYRNVIRSNKYIPFLYRYALYLSCIGYYKLAHNAYCILLNIRKRMKKYD